MKLKETPYYKQLVADAQSKIEDGSELNESTLSNIESDVLIQYGEHKKRLNNLKTKIEETKKDYSKSLSSVPLDYNGIKRAFMTEKVAETELKIAENINKIVFGIDGDEKLEA